MKLAKVTIKLVCALAAAAAVALPAHAYFIALDSTRTTGNQSWTGPLGMDFDVLAPIWVTKLGAFDSLANGFSNDINVGIYDRSTGLLVASATLNTGNTTAGGTNNRFFDIADFMLAAGSYSIVADGYGDAEQNGNMAFGGAGPTANMCGGLIAFTGAARYGNTDQGLMLPTIIDTGPSNRYDAGTFEYKAVPEPGSIALAGIGLFGLGLIRRRKRA